MTTNLQMYATHLRMKERKGKYNSPKDYTEKGKHHVSRKVHVKKKIFLNSIYSCRWAAIIIKNM